MEDLSTEVNYIQNQIDSLNKLVHYLLVEKYESEFKVIDGLNQHPEGLSYEDWFLKHFHK